MRTSRIGFLVVLVFFGVCGFVFGQQWVGDTTSTGTIYRLGNVGIGTNVPNGNLEVTDNTGPEIIIGNNDTSIQENQEIKR